MWWLLIPIGGAIAKVVYNVVTADDEPEYEPPPRKSTFEQNLERLKQELYSIREGK